MQPKPISRLIYLCLLAVPFIFLNSCSKSSDGGSTQPTVGMYYFKFKANGVQKEYKKNAAGSFNKVFSNGTDYGGSWGGTKEDFVATKDNFAILLRTVGKANLNTTYTNYATTAAGTAKAQLLTLAFLDENGVSLSSWSDDFKPAIPAGTETNAKVTVIESNATAFKGTFSGVIYNAAFTIKLVITDGEFLIEYK